MILGGVIRRLLGDFFLTTFGIGLCFLRFYIVVIKVDIF